MTMDSSKTALLKYMKFNLLFFVVKRGFVRLWKSWLKVVKHRHKVDLMDSLLLSELLPPKDL
jgi:hypothetical protein